MHRNAATAFAPALYDDQRTPSFPEGSWAPPPGSGRPALRVLTGRRMGESFVLGDGAVTLGRSFGVDVIVPDEGVSRRHARVRVRGALFTVTDLGSKNGTFVNDRRVTTPALLAPGDTVRLGPSAVLRLVLRDALDEAVERDLYARATSDPLTGALNRRGLDERLASEWAWARRHGQPLAACVLDADRFASVNDLYGHDAGDAVIAELAAVVRGGLRAEDALARSGGGELVVLARSTRRDAAIALAERLRERVAAHAFAHHESRIPVTISAGVATSDDEGIVSPETLLARADAAVYLAKAKGRNRVESY